MSLPSSPREHPVSNKPLDPILVEMEGYTRLGMHRDALRLAKGLLRAPKITRAQFESVIGTLMSTGPRRKRYRWLVEQAYAHLSLKAKHSARFWMLMFYHSVGDDAAASRFLPKRFNGPWGLIELAFAWDIWTGLEDKQSLEKHVRTMSAGAASANYPFTRGMLLTSLGDYYLRTGQWRLAAECYQEIPVESANAHQAVLGPVLALCGEFLTACNAARETHGRFRAYCDPDVEPPLPSALSNRHRDIEKQLNALQRGLGRQIGKNRFKKFGLLDGLKLTLDEAGKPTPESLSKTPPSAT